MYDYEFFAKVNKIYTNPKYILRATVKGKKPLSKSLSSLTLLLLVVWNWAMQPFCKFFSKDLYYRGLFMDKLASQGVNTTKVRARYSLHNSKFKKASLNNESLFNF